MRVNKQSAKGPRTVLMKDCLAKMATKKIKENDVLLLWIVYVFFLSCVCYVFVRVCLYVLSGHLLGTADLLALVCGV